MNRIIYSSIKYFKTIVLLFFFQQGFAQSQLSIADKFNAYSLKALPEKIFVHTDKEFYLAGEILWFKLYYVDGNSHHPMSLSKIAYVEILNDKNEPTLQAKISLAPGESNGSFYLPVSLNTGNYTLRAYTNWMKNFNAGYFFTKQITIVNTLKASEPEVKSDSSVLSVNFFPEGGNLVNGIQSRIGFEVKNKNGSVKDFNGYIINDNNDTVVFFSPLKFGIGNFDLTPQQGTKYKSVIVLPGSGTISKTLPPAYDNGYVLKLTENDQQQVIISVKRKRMAGEQPTNQILLAAHTRQVLKVAEKAFITDSAIFVIDKNRLDEGITHFTLFNNNDKPVCERLFYIKPQQKISVNVNTDRKEYTNRQRIDLSLNNNTGADQTPLNLSASVFYVDSLQGIDASNIVNYMWLVSDLAGSIESPDYYFSNDVNVAATADNLMLTHGWRRFKWEDVSKGDDSFIRHLPEINGQLVTGRVIDSRNGQPAAGINAYLSVPGRPFGFYTSRSDKNGIVRFEVKNYYGNSQIIAQPGIDADSFYTVNIIKPFDEITSPGTLPFYKPQRDFKTQILQRSIGMQVQNVYTGDSLRNFIEPLISDTLPFYGKAEASYKLDDYKRFTTMEEVLREYVLEVGVGMRNAKPMIKIFNPQEHDFYKGYALVLLDGIPLTDVNRIFEYDPLKVRKLDVIQTRYVLGQSIFNGIASFSTYEGGYDVLELDPKLLAIDYPGLQMQREFYSPVYETEEQVQKRIPDFRTTLFWTPDITTDKEGKATLRFYSADRKGKYIAVLQGMDEKGNFVSGTTAFEVN